MTLIITSLEQTNIHYRGLSFYTWQQVCIVVLGEMGEVEKACWMDGVGPRNGRLRGQILLQGKIPDVGGAE